MLAKLRATNMDDVRQVLGMPSKEADRCVNADDPGAECDAWLARNAAETRDTEGASMNGSEGLHHSAAENDTSDTDEDEAPAAEQEEAAESGGDDMQSLDLDAAPPARESAREPAVDGDGDAVVADAIPRRRAKSPIHPMKGRPRTCLRSREASAVTTLLNRRPAWPGSARRSI